MLKVGKQYALYESGHGGKKLTEGTMKVILKVGSLVLETEDWIRPGKSISLYDVGRRGKKLYQGKLRYTTRTFEEPPTRIVVLTPEAWVTKK